MRHETLDELRGIPKKNQREALVAAKFQTQAELANLSSSEESGQLAWMTKYAEIFSSLYTHDTEFSTLANQTYTSTNEEEKNNFLRQLQKILDDKLSKRDS